ncbi:MAG: hypothetical protein ACLRXQ_09005 [Phascolarctobacterium faecium]
MIMIPSIRLFSGTEYRDYFFPMFCASPVWNFIAAPTTVCRQIGVPELDGKTALGDEA